MAHDKIFSALGNPTRRKVLERLVGRPHAVVDLSRNLPVSRPAISQHLKALKDAGLVSGRTEGTRRIYRIDSQGLGELQRWLDRMRVEALFSFNAEAQRLARERKALK